MKYLVKIIDANGTVRYLVSGGAGYMLSVKQDNASHFAKGKAIELMNKHKSKFSQLKNVYCESVEQDSEGLTSFVGEFGI